MKITWHLHSQVATIGVCVCVLEADVHSSYGALLFGRIIQETLPHYEEYFTRSKVKVTNRKMNEDSAGSWGGWETNICNKY